MPRYSYNFQVVSVASDEPVKKGQEALRIVDIFEEQGWELVTITNIDSNLAVFFRKPQE